LAKFVKGKLRFPAGIKSLFRQNRGAVLENLIARLLTFAPKTQLLGMSATVSLNPKR